MVKLIKQEPVPSIGERLKGLVREGIQKGRFRNQQEFCEDFTGWVKEHHLAESFDLSPTIFSRWVTGRVTPRKDKIRLFAEFFDVNPEWISGESDRTRFHAAPVQLPEEWKQHEQELQEAELFWNEYERFRKYLESIGYMLEASGTEAETEQNVFRTYQNGMEYTWTEDTTTPTEWTFTVTFPDSSTVNLTEEQVTALMKRIRKQIELEFSLLKGDQQ